MLQMLLKKRKIIENYLYYLDIIEFRGKLMKTSKNYKISSIMLVLGLLCVPSISAVVIPRISENKVTFERQTPLNSGKPDLAMDSIGFVPIGDAQVDWVVDCSIINIGNGTAYGDINLAYTIRRLFSFIPVQSDTLYSSQSGLPPGQWTDFALSSNKVLPKFGFFRVTCEVNPDRTINESNYDNNKGAQNFLVLFGYWLAIS